MFSYLFCREKNLKVPRAVIQSYKSKNSILKLLFYAAVTLFLDCFLAFVNCNLPVPHSLVTTSCPIILYVFK